MGAGWCSNAGIKYGPIFSSRATSSENATDVYQIIPTAGYIKDLYIGLDEDPGTSPDAYKITLVKNGVDTDLTVTIIADDISGNDTSHVVAVTPGDYIYFKIEPIDTPSASPDFYFGMTFYAAVDGESILMGGLADAPTANSVEFAYVVSSYYTGTWNATEAYVQQLVNIVETVILKKLYFYLSAAPGAGESYTLKLRADGGDVGSPDTLSVPITGAATTGSDLVNGYTVGSYDLLTLSCTSSAGVTPAYGSWGLVSYINPGTEYKKWTPPTTFLKVHGWAWAPERALFYGVSRQTSKMIVFSFNPANGTFTNLVDSSSYMNSSDLVYRSGNDKVYVGTQIKATGLPALLEIDLDTGGITLRWTHPYLAGIVYNIAQDSTYIYIECHDSKVFARIKVSDWSESTTDPWGDAFSNTECMAFDGTYLWCGSNNSPVRVVKVDTTATPMTWSIINLAGINGPPCPQATIIGNYFVFGSEAFGNTVATVCVYDITDNSYVIYTFPGLSKEAGYIVPDGSGNFYFESDAATLGNIHASLFNMTSLIETKRSVDIDPSDMRIIGDGIYLWGIRCPTTGGGEVIRFDLPLPDYTPPAPIAGSTSTPNQNKLIAMGLI
jgi:hypothetical protein